MKPSSFEYVAPRTLDEAIHSLTSYAGAAKVLAGGQSLVPLMNLRLAAPEVLIDINGLDELGGLRAWDGGLSVGALVRQSTLERGPARVGGSGGPRTPAPCGCWPRRAPSSAPLQIAIAAGLAVAWPTRTGPPSCPRLCWPSRQFSLRGGHAGCARYPPRISSV